MAAIILEPVSTQSQIDTLCAIAKTVWHETYDDLLPPGQPDYMIEKFQSDHAVKEQMARENYRYVLAKLGEAYVGFVGYAPRYQGQEEMYLSKAYILPQGRGQGVVGALFRLVEEETKKEGLSRVRLTVNKGNAHAKAVYEHYGYRTVEAVRSDIGGGYVMDDYVMVKEL